MTAKSKVSARKCQVAAMYMEIEWNSKLQNLGPGRAMHADQQVETKRKRNENLNRRFDLSRK